jgi:tetratricopeptide (TPR) repeat protein
MDKLYGRVKDKWRSRTTGVVVNLPYPCQHIVLQRPDVITKINECIKTINEARAAHKGTWPVVSFLCGPPGVGKTQLAIDLVNAYQTSVRTIGWIDASSTRTTVRSLRALGMKLNEDALVNVERRYSGKAVDNSTDARLGDLKGVVQRELKRRRDWLLVVDGAIAESPQNVYLPLQGGHVDENWGSGIVVVTTRQNMFPKSKFTSVFSDCQMTNKEAGQLLQMLSGVPEFKLDGLNKLIDCLCGNSWSLASAGIYIGVARERNPQFGFEDYLHDYTKDPRNVNRTNQFLMKPMDMRFQQYTSQDKFGQKYEQLFMMLASTRHWRHAIPLSVVSQVLRGHSQHLTATDVLVQSMIKRCSIIEIQGQPDMSSSHNNGEHSDQKSLTDADGADISSSLLSVTFCHSLAHEASLERYGITNEGRSTVDADLHKLLKDTVRGTIIALTDNYLDALRLESIAALEKRRKLLPLFGKFLEDAEKISVTLGPLVKALTLACQAHAESTFQISQEVRNHLEDAQGILKNCEHNSHNLDVIRVQTLIGSAYRQLGHADIAFTELEKAFETLKKLPPSVDIDQTLYADTTIYLGVAYASLGKHKEAQNLFEKALGAFVSLIPMTTNDDLREACLNKIVHCQTSIGMVKLKRVTGDLGESHFDEALKILKGLKQESPRRAFALRMKAAIYRKRGSPKDLERSSTYLMEALAINQRYYGKNHTSVAAVMSKLSNIRRRQGQMKESLRLAEEAYEISKRVQFHMKAFNVNVASCLSSVARTKRDVGHLEDARSMFEESRKIYEDIYGQYHGDVIAQIAGLASVYRNMAKPREAERLLKDALKRCEQVQAEDQRARCNRMLAHVYEMLDMPRKAFEHWETALKLYGEYERRLRGVTTTSQVAVCKAHLAYLKLDLNDPVYAEEVLENLLEPYYAHTGDKPYSPEMTHVLYIAGKLREHSQRYGEAIDIFHRVLDDQKKFWGDSHPRLAVTLVKKASTLLALYRKQNIVRFLDEADRCLEEAQTNVNKYLSTDHLLSAEVHSSRGFLLCERHLMEQNNSLAVQADSEFDKALTIWRTTLGKDNRKYAKSMAGKANVAYLLQKNVVAELYALEARHCFERSKARMLAVPTGTHNRRVNVDIELENVAKTESQMKCAFL